MKRKRSSKSPVYKLFSLSVSFCTVATQTPLITRRYLKNQGSLVKSALGQFVKEYDLHTKQDFSKQEAELWFDSP